ncbi:MAG: hypothetical protein PVF15_03275 [Candidatus Bathyarchaeota archaeon]|jgi:uncharacterized membrane protein YfcA
MRKTLQLHTFERLITNDPKGLFTLTSCILILAIYVNLNTVKSTAVGIVTLILYSLINGVFLAEAFFNQENALLRLLFGLLTLTMLLGFVGWLVVIIYNLDTLQFIVVLFIVTTLSSLSNRRNRDKNAT